MNVLNDHIPFKKNKLHSNQGELKRFSAADQLAILTAWMPESIMGSKHARKKSHDGKTGSGKNDDHESQSNDI